MKIRGLDIWEGNQHLSYRGVLKIFLKLCKQQWEDAKYWFLDWKGLVFPGEGSLYIVNRAYNPQPTFAMQTIYKQHLTPHLEDAKYWA